MLSQLIECGFLVDQEAAYKRVDALKEEPKLTEYKLTSVDYVTPQADLRRLISPAGLAWMRAPASELRATVELIDGHPKHPHMCRRVAEIFHEHSLECDLRADGRPILNRIWKIFYSAQLFASGTKYIIFDQVRAARTRRP